MIKNFNFVLLIVGIFSAPYSFANPISPLIDKFYSYNCNSPESSVSTFLKNNNENANYTYISYSKNKEDVKASGFAELEKDRSVTMVENYVFRASGNKISSGSAHIVIKIIDNGYKILYQADDGKVSFKNGQAVYTENSSQTKTPCSSDSVAVRAAVGLSPEKMTLPAAPDKNTRLAILNQPTSLISPDQNTLNTIGEEMKMWRVKNDGFDVFIALPNMCRALKKLLIVTQAIAVEKPMAAPMIEKVQNEIRNCTEGMEDSMGMLETNIANAQKITTADCTDAKLILSKMKEGNWSSSHINRMNKSTMNACNLAQKSSPSDIGSDSAELNKLVKSWGVDCKSYNQAKATCAPAVDFQACMSRLGAASSLTRTSCAPMFSPNGW